MPARPTNHQQHPHHDGSEWYVSNPHPTLGEVVTVFVRVPRTLGVPRLWIRSRPDGALRLRAARVDRSGPYEVVWRCDLPAHNPVNRYRFLLDSAVGYRWLTAAGVSDWEPPEASDFCLTTFPAPPEWVRDAIFYQIFPDRFADSGRPRDWPTWAVRSTWDDPVATDWRTAIRQVYGGDLPGIACRLDHLADLGVNAVYLTPFFSAPSSHRYNADDFTRVDPLLGGDAGLAELSSELHRRDMRLLGDLTLHHCGSSHPWFRAAHELGAAASSADFFHRDGDDFAYTRGIPTLPKLNYGSARVRHAMVSGKDSVVARWLRPPFNLDGWRVDLANMVGRFQDVELNRQVARWTRATMRSVNPSTYLVGEHMYDATPDLLGDGWHGAMNYSGFTWPVLAWLGDTELLERAWFMGNPVMPSLPGPAVAAALDAYRALVPWTATAHALNLLGSHDTPRWRSVAGSSAAAVVGVGLLICYPGVPSILYGDEIGLTGVNGDQARAPMPWQTDRWDWSLLDAYRALIRLRRRSSALTRGGFRWCHVGDDTLVFLRESATERLLVQASRTSHPEVRVSAGLLGGSADAEPLYGDGKLDRQPDGDVLLPGDGPALRVWRLHD
jgi:alpha-glucosidase